MVEAGIPSSRVEVLKFIGGREFGAGLGPGGVGAEV